MNQMSDEQIRIKIAEACGWKRIDPFKCGKEMVDWAVWEKDGKRASLLTDTLPNWPADLNACAEFEKTLTVTQCVEYDRLLTAIQCRDNVEAEGKTECEADYSAFHAKAPQRCEAFLRTLNLWTE